MNPGGVWWADVSRVVRNFGHAGDNAEVVRELVLSVQVVDDTQ